MSDKSPEKAVDDLLKGLTETKKPCAVERNEPLAAALRHFLALKAKGEAEVALEWFYENKLKELYNGPSMTTVRRWVRKQ